MWKAYGTNPDSAIKKIDTLIAELRKSPKKTQNSSEITKASLLATLKKQAEDAVSYFSYGSEQYIPRVIAQSSNPEHNAGYFG